MLLGLALIVAVCRIADSSSSPPKDVNDDELFRALDKELEDILEDAIDKLPQRLDDFTLQNLEASGELPPVTSTEVVTTGVNLQAVTSSSVVPATPPNFTTGMNQVQVVSTSSPVVSLNSQADLAEQKALNASSVSMLLQMLSSMAVASLPARPGVGEIADRLIAEAVNEEVMELLTNTTIPTEENFGTPSTVSTSTAGAQSTSTTLTTANTTNAPSLAAPLASSRTPEIHVQPRSSTTIPDLKSVTSKRSTCLKDAICYSDDECGKGQCHGVSLGKCNCHACLATLPCKDDIDCGGLTKSCQNGTCRCAEALAKHGYPLFVVALTNFCSQRTCTVESNSCYGLPCNHGKCHCT
uniref:Dickkopf_N domain-containing protein n=1 Tax=Haemonchus contortus TaxID=6289 RepID=A0A7I4YTN9_HAECO